jgi:hypothetical protein
MDKEKDIVLTHLIKHLDINNSKQIITLQKYVRRFLQRKKILIPLSKYQTKEWRKKRQWYTSGKSNECEKYQIKLIEQITTTKCNKTHDRINIFDLELKEKRTPMKMNDGFEWTENFDCKMLINNCTIYCNLKFVCDNGGAQTRSLREVYHFINSQINHMIKYNTKGIYFINILDGDTSYSSSNKFEYLINKSINASNNIIKNKIKKYIFCGDMNEFQHWWINSKFYKHNT